MQIFITRPKFVISAVLSCSLLIALSSGNFNIATRLGSPDTRALIQLPTYPLWSSLNAEFNVAPLSTPPSAKFPTPAAGQIKAQTQAPSTETDSVWDNIGAQLKLNHRANSAQVRAEIRKLLADQGKLYSILKAAGPYIYFIHKQTEVRGLPAELALIPVIESEYNPNDHSKKGATGLWQLMPGTAHELGIKVKSSYDGRRSVVASTKAALAYFNDLGHLFDGDWDLAIAAYNCGQVKVKSVQRRTGSEDFWIYLCQKKLKAMYPSY